LPERIILEPNLQSFSVKPLNPCRTIDLFADTNAFWIIGETLDQRLGVSGNYQLRPRGGFAQEVGEGGDDVWMKAELRLLNAGDRCRGGI
jgi:hypothetical protein